MNKSLFLTSVSLTASAATLGLAMVLLAPAKASFGFSKLGSSLNVGSERDYRILNNFLDSQTNNNQVPVLMFPGWQGADQALWKAAAEWGSTPHGDGSGDPTQSIGDGQANFDFFFGGASTGAGNGASVVSSLTSCGGGGVFAYVSNGGNTWNMRFCDDEWVWSDGPGGPGGSQIDLQGVGCHEFGHSLGLGHSGANGATMVGSTFNGFEQRSIEADDIGGVQCIYGAIDPGKPIITGVIVDVPGSTMTINGSNFSAANNAVWFTNFQATAPNTNPTVLVSGVASPTTTSITISIPADAGDGDVHVRNTLTGGKGLSNGWPVDLMAASGPMINISSITPGTVESLIVGPDQTVTISGSGFSASTTVTIDSVPVDPASYTFVNAFNITVDMPQVSSLGTIDVRVDDGILTDTETIQVVAPSQPLLQIGNGLDFNNNTIVSSNGLDFIFAGPPGDFHYVLYSSTNAGGSIPIVTLCIGANFIDLFELTNATIEPEGYNQQSIPLSPIFTIFYFQSLSFSQGLPIPTSNCQEALFVP